MNKKEREIFGSKFTDFLNNNNDLFMRFYILFRTNETYIGKGKLTRKGEKLKKDDAFRQTILILYLTMKHKEDIENEYVELTTDEFEELGYYIEFLKEKHYFENFINEFEEV